MDLEMANIARNAAEATVYILVTAYTMEQTEKEVYYSHSSGSSDGTGGKVWLFYIFALIIGYGINELLGTILLIGMIFWLLVCK